MTVAQYPEIALPPGADRTDDEWEPAQDGHLPYRCVWSEPRDNGRLDIRAVVVQFADGTIGSEGEDGPLIYVGCEDYPPDDARAIAIAIIAAADLADQWAGRSADEPRLTEVKSAVLEAYTALDSITVAQAALR